MRQVYRALKTVLQNHPEAAAIFPVHKNPKVREVVQAELAGTDRVYLTEPMDYEPFANLMNHADIVLTDSGGIQEEAPALGKPVLVLRNTTERPEAVTAGTVRLTGTVYEVVKDEASRLLEDPAYYRSMAEAVNPYGDGQASHRIVTWLLQHYGYPVEAAAEFCPGK
jgi:UDP-N-acetylglucosamine 2-epimerase (non-hydrolysing)